MNFKMKTHQIQRLNCHSVLIWLSKLEPVGQGFVLVVILEDFERFIRLTAEFCTFIGHKYIPQLNGQIKPEYESVWDQFKFQSFKYFPLHLNNILNRTYRRSIRMLRFEDITQRNQIDFFHFHCKVHASQSKLLKLCNLNLLLGEIHV